MKDFIKERFLKVAEKTNSFYKFRKNKDASFEEIIEKIREIRDFGWSNFSDLTIFNEAVAKCFNILDFWDLEAKFDADGDLIKMIQADKLEAKILYSDLISIIENEIREKKFPFTNYEEYRKKIDPENDLNFNLYVPFLLPFEELFAKELEFINTKEDALLMFDKVLETIEYFLNDILICNIKKWFDRTEINQVNPEDTERTKYFENVRKEFIQSWKDCTVTTSQWNVFSKYDLWDMLENEELTEEQREKIEVHQNELFFTEVNWQVDTAIESLLDSKFDKTEAIRRELNLIEKFVNGDISKITITRIKSIIDFSNPTDVLVKFDEITKFGYFDPYNYYIYTPNKYRTYHPYFVAHFINKYSSRLRNALDGKNQRAESTGSPLVIDRIEKNSFMVRNKMKEELISKLRTLDMKLDFINKSKSTIEDLFNILFTENYEKENSVHLSCETAQFAYIAKSMRPYFMNFYPKSIGESKLFLSKKGNLIKSQNLYSSSIHNPKQKVTIDQIFKQ